MNKKAMLDDALDFMFLIIAAFFLMFFLWVYISSSAYDTEKSTNSFVYLTEESTKVINNGRYRLETGEEVDLEEVKNQINSWRLSPK